MEVTGILATILVGVASLLLPWQRLSERWVAFPVLAASG